jgi:quinol monooxygenase YgiN
MILLALAACNLHTPFDGPGMADGALATDHEGPFVVAVTYARSAPGEGRRFGDHVTAIEEQLADADGLVGYSLRGDLVGRDNWTLSVWESEDALLAFLTTGAHLAALGEAGTVLQDSRFASWDEPDRAALPPTWDQALAFLEE